MRNFQNQDKEWHRIGGVKEMGYDLDGPFEIPLQEEGRAALQAVGRPCMTLYF